MKRLLLYGFILSMVATPPAYSQAKGGKEIWSFLTDGNYRPFIEASYGLGLMDHKAVSVDLPKMGVAGAKLGFREMKPMKRWGVRDEERFIIGSSGSHELELGETGTDGLTGEFWRIGTGQRIGYGWTLGGQPLVPYHQYTFNYFEPMMEIPTTITGSDSATLARAVDGGRFGMSTEGGVHVELFNSLGASAGYELSVLYTRVVFPQWFASYLIGASAIGLISAFSEEIINSSHIFGPIIYFVLRNGASYALFYAWRDQMHWPFASETPLVIHTVKLDFSIKF